MKLFEIPEKEPDKPGITCRHCEFVIRNYWNKNLKYCSQQPRSGGKYKKIKSGDQACNRYIDNRLTNRV
jgi:hypothetical protein